jgi:hypothetical protein
MRVVHDQNLKVSFFISLFLHFVVGIIISVVFVQQTFERRPHQDIIEVEIVNPQRQRATHLPKRPFQKAKKKIPPQRISPFIRGLKEEVKIGDILSGSFGQRRGGRVRYGVLPREFGQRAPLFERVEMGVNWGKGPITTSEIIQKGNPLTPKIKPELPLKESGLQITEKIEEKERRSPKKVKKPKEDYRIEGPAGDRKILYQPKIPLPKWIEEEGISLQGRFKFWVLPSGEVEWVEKIETFGYPKVDELALLTIRRWRFSEGEGKAWGIVTVKIRLGRDEKVLR